MSLKFVKSNSIILQECDIVASAAATPSRIALFQFAPWMYYSTVPFVIPRPGESAHITNPLSLVQPFQLPVDFITYRLIH